MTIESRLRAIERLLAHFIMDKYGRDPKRIEHEATPIEISFMLHVGNIGLGDELEKLRAMKHLELKGQDERTN